MTSGYRQYWQEYTWYGIGIVLAVFVLYASSLFNYLLFHCLIEVVTVSVVLMLFGVTWNPREYLVNGYLRLPGIGFAFIVLIDLIHTLAHKGMGVLPDSSNLSAQLWIVARYLQAATLVAAPFFVGRKINDYYVIVAFVSANILLLALIFSSNFPDCYINGKGLTDFNIGSEYVITVVLLVSLYLSYRKRDQDGNVARLLGMGMDIDEHKWVEQKMRESNEELARFNRAATERELRMIDLKPEVNELTEASGQVPRYELDFTEVTTPDLSQ